MGGISEVGVFCTVCHRWNDGASDFCTCRESLIGYRPLNTMQFEKWVKNQLLEREAAGLPTSPEGLDALKAWARGGGLSHHVAASDVGMGCGLAALWVVGLVFTFVGVGAWVYLEDASRGASESDLVLVMLVPLALLGIQCLAVAVGLTIWQIAKRSGDRQNVEMTERT